MDGTSIVCFIFINILFMEYTVSAQGHIPQWASKEKCQDFSLWTESQTKAGHAARQWHKYTIPKNSFKKELPILEGQSLDLNEQWTVNVRKPTNILEPKLVWIT